MSEMTEESKENLPENEAPANASELLSLEETEKVLEDVAQHTQDPQEEEIALLKKQVEEQKEKYLRLFADFDNFKKRNAKERLELIQTASKEVIKDMLPVVDDLERALKAADSATDVQAVKEGMNLIAGKFMKTLEAKGLKAIEAKGCAFDVSLHEAISEIPAPTPDMAGKVIEEVEKGYFLNEKIIRFAKVIVGK